MTSGPLFVYREKLAKGEIKQDPAQELAAEKLQSLHHALDHYQPQTGTGGWRERFGIGRRKSAATPPQGLYIYGEVGRGKSMLTDLFFDGAPVAAKRRVHFHAFMREVHERLKAWRDKTKGSQRDPIEPLAKELSQEAWLLCFDEFQVDNIADAMILGRLFECLFEAGVVVVATSNRVPDDLYKDGLQRDRFLPFIDLIKHKLDVMELASPNDYRLGRVMGGKVYFCPDDANARARMDSAFKELCGADGAPDYLVIKSRQIEIPRAHQHTAYFSFADLCERPYGAGIYLEIATHFDTVFIEGIPLLSPQNRNEATRFVHLIDAFYEHKVKLVCSAAAAPQDLYVSGDGSFEFQRTVSRLMEMQSQDYLQSLHLT